MTSNEPPSSAVASGVPLSRTRSFPNAMAALLFSHRAWSSTEHEYVAQVPSQPMTTADDDQRTSRAVSISGLLGSHYERGGFNWVDPDASLSKASPPSSSSTSMRRSETWTTSLQGPNDNPQNATRPTPETSAGSGSLRALQRSLSEVFGPSKIVINMADEVRHEIPAAATIQSTSRTPLSPLRVSAPSSHAPDVSRATPHANEPDHSHPRSVLKRQSSLAAVPESEPPTREILPSPAHPNVDDRQPLKARLFSMPGTVAETPSVDENQNAVGLKNHGDAIKMAAGEMTSRDHVMQVPETTFSAPSKRLGIMELLASGERRRIRNRDVNLVAPQSW